MSVYSSQSLNKEHIKIRWAEPYVSHALNRKSFGTHPKGIYAGFNIVPVGYRTYQINGTDPMNFQGNTEEYAQGNYSAVSGYSVAIFEDTLGHNVTVNIPPGGVSGTFEFDFTGIDDQQRIIVAHVDYMISNETTGQVMSVDAAELVAHPEYLVLGVINLPSNGVSGSSADIDFEDATYPRTLPFATPYKYGFMSPDHASILAGIGAEGDILFTSDNDAEVWWRLIDVSGADSVGRLDFTGNIYYRQPTESFDILLAVSGTTVSGIADDDVVYFSFPLDGSVTGVGLNIAPNHMLPAPSPTEQLVVLGMRDYNDFWFKTGQKWEVGELKPFGVTSKFPNLTVGETGNPPVADGVSGIFFDNAIITVLPGGKDVRVFTNVSGTVPFQPLEEEFLVLSGSQSSFTTTNPDFFWTVDDSRFEVKVYKNGMKLIQYTSSTSGLTYSDGTPVWEFRRTGTRTVTLREPAVPNCVITLRQETDRGINAYEENYLISSTGIDTITAGKEFNPDNNVHDITVYRNGAKVQYRSLPLHPYIHGVSKISNTDLQFETELPVDSVITIRYESSLANLDAANIGVSGDYWWTPVDSHINPDTDGIYDIGTTNRFRNANFAGDGSFGGDFYIGGKLNVSGGIDPLYLQLTPIDPAEAPLNSFFVDQNTLGAKFKNQSGESQDVGSDGGGGETVSGIEFETLYNPYPFAITAPKAVSVSSAGPYFVLTDINDSASLDNFFGVLVQNVSANGTLGDSGFVQWRGKTEMIGFANGPLFAGSAGVPTQTPPSVSGTAVLKLGIIRNDVFYSRPGEVIPL